MKHTGPLVVGIFLLLYILPLDVRPLVILLMLGLQGYFINLPT
jgi:hypothetical protein